jgi:hypothetical protein
MLRRDQLYLNHSTLVRFFVNLDGNENNTAIAKPIASLLDFDRNKLLCFFADCKEDPDVLCKSSASETLEPVMQGFALAVVIRIFKQRFHFLLDDVLEASVLSHLLFKLIRIFGQEFHPNTSL